MHVDSVFDAAADDDGGTDDGHVVDERTNVIDLDQDDEPGSDASSPAAVKCLTALLLQLPVQCGGRSLAHGVLIFLRPAFQHPAAHYPRHLLQRLQARGL